MGNVERCTVGVVRHPVHLGPLIKQKLCNSALACGSRAPEGPVDSLEDANELSASSSSSRASVPDVAACRSMFTSAPLSMSRRATFQQL